MTQIWVEVMHGMQRHASDSGQTYAQGAETRLKLKGHLCPGCRDMNQILG